jgi:hypothetical protein
MATADDVRRIALSLPETDEHPSYGGRPSFGCARRASPGSSTTARAAASGPSPSRRRKRCWRRTLFFTTPHHDGYATVLVRYAAVDVDELRELITDSWRVKAPKRVVAAFETQESA